MRKINYVIGVVIMSCFNVFANDAIIISSENAAEYNVRVKVESSEIYNMYEINVVVGRVPSKWSCLTLSKVNIGFYNEKNNELTAIVPLALNGDGELKYNFTLRKESIKNVGFGVNYINSSNDNKCEEISQDAFVIDFSDWIIPVINK
ncbi:hypothetical protein ACQKE0_18245 [Shewanella colwelliana]|uniref:hypothetical protein n=1 Tax=Shewanella colwelliana TaxID=23 RepID=UPI003D0774A7